MQHTITMENNIAFIEVKNESSLAVTFSSLGASIYRVEYKGKNRIMTPLNHEEFFKNEQYYGKAIGRFSGRINDAKCEIDGVSYTLPKNWNGINSLHGGNLGISFSNFSFDVEEYEDHTAVEFTFTERESYLPGDVAYKITYRVYEKTNEIRMEILAYTTRKTIVNVTNHTYWTLSAGKRTVLDEELTLACKYAGDLDNNLIAKSIVEVSECMDFREGHTIGKYIDAPYLQNHTSFGYDHFFVKEDEGKPFVAKLVDQEEGISLTVSTSYPAIVVYTDNYTTKMKFENVDEEKKYQAIALECQYIPNGINMKNVNPALLSPGDKYEEYISFVLE